MLLSQQGITALNMIDSSINEENVVINFSCELIGLKHLVDVLSCLQHGTKRDEYCSVELSLESIIISLVSKSKSMQSRVTLLNRLFNNFIYESNNESTIVSLCYHDLLDSLILYNTSLETTSMTLSFSTIDFNLKVSLEESSILTTSELSAIDSSDINEEDLFSSYHSYEELTQIIFSSNSIKDAISDLGDFYGISSVMIEIKKNPKEMFKLSATGSNGDLDITFEKSPSQDVFISFNCNEDISFIYNLQSFQLGMKCSHISKETLIRINSVGVMCVQHLVETPHGDVYADFLMIPALAN